MAAATHGPGERVDTETPSTSARLAAMAVLSVLVGVAIWLYSATIAILPGSPTTEFVFFLPGLRTLGIFTIGAACVLALVWTVVGRRRGMLWPLTLLAFPVATIGLLATSARDYAPAWLFTFFDWQWWFLALIGILVLQNAIVNGDGQGASEVTMRQPRRRITIGVVVMVVLFALTMVFSPAGRFDGRTDGDEPKYLRFDENWYRGRGLDIANLPDIKDVPPGSTPAVLANVPRLVDAARLMAGDFRTEVCHFVGRCDAPPRATKGSNLFVEGKRGGLYQVHYPGVSLLLLPAYWIDRTFLNSTNDFHPHFPTHLYATNAALIAFYLIWAFALYRLAAIYSGKAILAAVLTVVVMTSLPATAFTYQYYPEAAAGMLLTLIAAYLITSGDTRLAVACAYGLMSGFMVWLHLRFGSVAIVAPALFWAKNRHVPRAGIAFAGGAALPLVALALYNYHIGGSVCPWVIWNLQPDSPGFSVTRMTRDLPRFWSDRGAGLVAHAPVYLLALPGILPMWRRQRFALATIALLVVPVAAISAAHSFSAGWTTPGRYIAALAPLLALPMSETVDRYRRSPWFISFALLLALLSTSNGLLYDVNFVRGRNDLRNPSVAGWSTTLLFSPVGIGNIDVTPWAWWAVTLFLLLLPVLRPENTNRTATPAQRTLAMAVTLLIFVTAGSAVGAWSGRTFERKYQPADTYEKALSAHLSRSDGLVWSGPRGLTDAARVIPSGPGPLLAVAPSSGTAGQPLDLRLELKSATGALTWGRAAIRFGDDNSVTRTAIVGSASVRHTFAQPGHYRVLVDVDAGDTQSITRAVVVDVTGR